LDEGAEISSGRCRSRSEFPSQIPHPWDFDGFCGYHPHVVGLTLGGPHDWRDPILGYSLREYPSQSNRKNWNPKTFKISGVLI